MTVMNINATWMQPSCTATGTPILRMLPSTSLGAQVAALNVDVRAAALEPHEREDNAGRLGGYRAERRTHGAEPHVSDKQKVERDVDDACHANHVHGRARIAQPAKDSRKNVVCGDKRNADKADTQVGGGSFDCLGRRANERHDLRAQCEQDSGQHHRDTHKERDGVADGGLGAVEATRAHAWPTMTVVPMARPTSVTVMI